MLLLAALCLQIKPPSASWMVYYPGFPSSIDLTPTSLMLSPELSAALASRS